MGFSPFTKAVPHSYKGMSSLRIISAVGIILFVLTGAAKAAGKFAIQTFMRICGSGDKAEDLACSAYVSGFWNGFRLGDAAASGEGRTTVLCPPKGLTAGHIKDMTVEYMRRRPVLANDPADKALLLTLMPSRCK